MAPYWSNKAPYRFQKGNMLIDVAPYLQYGAALANMAPYLSNTAPYWTNMVPDSCALFSNMAPYWSNIAPYSGHVIK